MRPHWGHSRPGDAIEIAREARVKQLCLFHHAPMRSDRQRSDPRDGARECGQYGKAWLGTFTQHGVAMSAVALSRCRGETCTNEAKYSFPGKLEFLGVVDRWAR